MSHGANSPSGRHAPASRGTLMSTIRHGSQAFGTAIVGLIYVGATFFISLSAIIIAKQYGGWGA